MKLAELIIELSLQTGNIPLVGAFFLTTGTLEKKIFPLTFVETLFLTSGARREDALDL